MVDVVVAGGGPVGMLLAAELELAGVHAIVLEKLPRPSGHSRAFRLQARTIELLDSRGLLDRFGGKDRTWPKAHFAGLQPLLDLSRLDSAHPYSWLAPQARTEAILAQRAAELGAEIRRGHEVVGLRQDPTRVTLRVAGPQGEYELGTDWLVGCDGGRSTVRNLAGIDFPGTVGTVSALLGDVQLDDPSALPSGVPGTLRTERGLLMAVALEEGVTRVLTTEFGRPAPGRDVEVTLAELSAAVTRVTGARVVLREPRWLSRFSDATRLAAGYRKGRVFLAGDAAHVHFPIGAQGLNLGLQDALNLGWKLAAVVRGTAPETVLDSYDAERRPVAVRVLRETRAQLALMNPDPRTDPLRELFSDLLALDEVNLFLANLMTGVDVRYDMTGRHPLTGRAAPELTVVGQDGARRLAELARDGRPLLVDLHPGGDAARVAQPWAGEVHVVRGAADGFTAAEALLVRPDGYVAWAGDARVDTDGLRGALATWFGARPGPTPDLEAASSGRGHDSFGA